MFMLFCARGENKLKKNHGKAMLEDCSFAELIAKKSDAELKALVKISDFEFSFTINILLPRVRVLHIASSSTFFLH